MLRVHRLIDKQWHTEEGIAAASQAAQELDSTPVWVEATAPDPDECAALYRCFGIRERTLEDALEPQHPPVFREFDEHIFLIVHAPETSAREETRKIALFLGHRWLLTVVRAPLPMLEPLREQLLRHAIYYLDAPDLLAHAILDHMAQIFEERVDEMIDLADVLSERALEEPSPDVLPEIQHLRRRTSAFTRIVRTQRDVYQSLARGGCPFLTRRVEPHLRDIADHMLRVYDLLEAVRDGIVAARDSYLTAVNYELNETMRKLTSIATILLPLGLVAGVFGMNFEWMPLIHRPFGFPIAIGGMITLALGLYAWLRSRRWL
jgi:magnesium transporter